MNDRQAKLEARVIAVNRAHKYANELYPKLVAVFEGLVGQTVLKATGDLTAKVEKLLPQLPSSVGLHVYRYRNNYSSLAWIVKTWENIKNTNTCLYHEVTVYIGNLDGQILTSLAAVAAFRTDYTAEEVTKKRQLYEEAKSVADAAESDLYPFGRYDN